MTVDKRIKSGRRVVAAICSGTFDRFLIPTLNCQSLAVDSRQKLSLHADWLVEAFSSFEAEETHRVKSFEIS